MGGWRAKGLSGPGASMGLSRRTPATGRGPSRCGPAASPRWPCGSTSATKTEARYKRSSTTSTGGRFSPTAAPGRRGRPAFPRTPSTTRRARAGCGGGQSCTASGPRPARSPARSNSWAASGAPLGPSTPPDGSRRRVNFPRTARATAPSSGAFPRKRRARTPTRAFARSAGRSMADRRWGAGHSTTRRRARCAQCCAAWRSPTGPS